MTSLRLRPIFLVLATGLSASLVNAGPPKADLVLTNGIVYTVQAKPASVEAVAVTGGRIAAVGTSQALARLVGPKTRVIDLEGPGGGAGLRGQPRPRAPGRLRPDRRRSHESQDLR